MAYEKLFTVALVFALSLTAVSGTVTASSEELPGDTVEGTVSPPCDKTQYASAGGCNDGGGGSSGGDDGFGPNNGVCELPDGEVPSVVHPEWEDCQHRAAGSGDTSDDLTPEEKQEQINEHDFHYLECAKGVVGVPEDSEDVVESTVAEAVKKAAKEYIKKNSGKLVKKFLPGVGYVFMAKTCIESGFEG